MPAPINSIIYNDSNIEDTLVPYNNRYKNNNENNDIICHLRLKDYFQLYLNSIFVVAYFFSYKDYQSYCGSHVENTPLMNALHPSEFSSIIIACVASVTIGVVLISSMLCDHVMDIPNATNDFLEQFFLSICSLSPLMFIFWSIKYDVKYLPFLFVAIFSFQLPAYGAFTFNLMKKSFPLVFTYMNTQLLIAFGNCVSVFSMIGFGNPVLYWANILFIVFILLTPLTTFYLFRKVMIQCNYFRKELNSSEFLAMTYFTALSTTAIIVATTSLIFLADFLNYNTVACNALIYGTLVYTISVFFIPSKVIGLKNKSLEVKLAKEKVNSVQQTLDTMRLILNEREREIRNEKKVTKMKNDLLLFLSSQVRDPLVVVNRSLLFLMEDITSITPENITPAIISDITGRAADAVHSSDSAIWILNDYCSSNTFEFGKFTISQEMIEVIPFISTITKRLKFIGTEKNVSIVTESMVDYRLFANFDQKRIEEALRSLILNCENVCKENGFIKVIINSVPIISLEDMGEKIIFGINQKETKHDQFRQLSIEVISNYSEETSNIKIKMNKMSNNLKTFDPNLYTGKSSLGLGLFVANKIVNLHDGSIFFDSNDIEKGTCFKMIFPLLHYDFDPYYNHSNSIIPHSIIKVSKSSSFRQDILVSPSIASHFGMFL